MSEAIEAEERKRAEIAAKRLAAKERRAARKAGTIKELIAGVNQAQDKFDKVIHFTFDTIQILYIRNKQSEMKSRWKHLRQMQRRKLGIEKNSNMSSTGQMLS